MPSFGEVSRDRLDTCDTRLIAVFEEVVKTYDCSIEGGGRTLEEQEANVAKGVSKTLESKHVITPLHPLSRAVDAAPFPVIWPNSKQASYVHDVGRFYHFAGYVKKVAEMLNIKLRWGGDWDSDGDYRDQVFDDLDHYELIED
jgi:peptidoglycan L-alanyl-D-glutamate endopeptidase CwlK